MGNIFERDLLRHKDAIVAVIAQQARELAEWRTWGIVEVSIRNPNVAEYMWHWEGRAKRAERYLDAARACIAACEERINEWCNYCGGNRTTCDNAPGQCPARDARAVIKETP